MMAGLRNEHQWRSRSNLPAREPRRPDDRKPRLALKKVAGHRGWVVAQTYEDQGISGAKGRDQRPAFDQMLKDAVRRQFDVLMVWSIDRLGRSVLHVANALAELDAAGVALYSDQQAIDSTDLPLLLAEHRAIWITARPIGVAFAAGSSPAS
jgi:DNA invertase Pin-like site-specific DNA recombinase